MPVGVMHLTDSLGAGGAERVAVNIVNCLPRSQFTPYLCATREEGALSSLVEADVGRLHLNRQGRFDVHAVRRLIGFIKKHDIEILHAHTSSLFIAAFTSLFPPFPKVVWHDHYGRHESEARPVRIYRQAVKRVQGIIAVNESLADWSRNCLRVPRERVWYIPNFTIAPESNGEQISLPGTSGARIVCVANFRRQKDHLTLVKAMRRVVEHEPAAQLFLVGVAVDEAYIEEIRCAIDEYNLASNINWLGECSGVISILKQCDIGVMSSTSEGLPLALLEYGTAKLAVVATEVGQCAEVLANGQAGLLVPPSAPELLAEKLLSLLASPPLRHEYAATFHRRVQEVYSPEAALGAISRIYDIVIGRATGEIECRTSLKSFQA